MITTMENSRCKIHFLDIVNNKHASASATKNSQSFPLPDNDTLCLYPNKDTDINGKNIEIIINEFAIIPKIKPFLLCGALPGASFM